MYPSIFTEEFEVRMDEIALDYHCEGNTPPNKIVIFFLAIKEWLQEVKQNYTNKA